MKYAIFLIEKKANDSFQENQQLLEFQERAKNKVVLIRRNLEHCVDLSCKISESSWLVQLETNTQALGCAISLAQECGQAYRVLYFSEAPVVFSNTALDASSFVF